jgi:hypothetical protein
MYDQTHLMIVLPAKILAVRSSRNPRQDVMKRRNDLARDNKHLSCLYRLS